MANLVPLKLHMHGCATQEEMNANVTAALERGYTPINDYLTPELGGKSGLRGTVSICGAAPSLADTYQELTGHIMACNSAIGFLVGKGIIPTYGMIWDASPLCEKFAIPDKRITYLLGARCHPSVFDKLKGCKVIAWHAGGDHNILEFLRQNDIREPTINGGSAAVTRAMYLAYAMGYRKLHLFGADSSFRAGDSHVNGSLATEKQLEVFIDGKPFQTTPEFCAQVEEFKVIYPHFTAFGCSVTVHGDGMLPHVYSIMKNCYAFGGTNATTCI